MCPLSNICYIEINPPSNICYIAMDPPSNICYILSISGQVRLDLSGVGDRPYISLHLSVYERAGNDWHPTQLAGHIRQQ